jgi:hypothetical protein
MPASHARRRAVDDDTGVPSASRAPSRSATAPSRGATTRRRPWTCPRPATRRGVGRARRRGRHAGVRPDAGPSEARAIAPTWPAVISPAASAAAAPSRWPTMSANATRRFAVAADTPVRRASHSAVSRRPSPRARSRRAISSIAAGGDELFVVVGARRRRHRKPVTTPGPGSDAWWPRRSRRPSTVASR